MNPAETIVAISSAAGASARMIVRLAGRDAFALASSVTTDDLPASAATRTRLRLLDLFVPATLYAFRAPRSYTGDDLIEFHLPGNPLVARLLIDHLTAAGARGAEPGEFTARAYFNGRLDLAEAEGVAATISASNERELAAARQLLAGELSRRLRPAIDLVADTLSLVEAEIDFADEGISFVARDDVLARIDRADGLLLALLNDSGRFEPLAHEPVAVLVGRPNAGKSTLLNALAGRERAVVSPVAGTTRDALSADVAVAGGMIRLVDVAGLEDPDVPADTSPAAADVRRQMQAQAVRAIESADLIVLVRDPADAVPAVSPPRPPNLTVWSKADLHPATGERRNDLRVSAATGEGLATLRAELGRLAFGDRGTGASALALNARHVGCVESARSSAADARAAAASGQGGEFIAHHLRASLDALGAVLGAVTPDDLLGRIFSSFCIGK